ncbi:unnamed protein product [Peniophora sp. CBMAI 1063]|nr:unnamed protein product [Peniophora sp. CBMAI 1063]
MPHIDDVPSELRILVCAHIYAAGLPPLYPSLDPTYTLPAGAPTSQPTSYPPSTWTEPVARTTLANLSLVNKAWCSAARPWLWRKIEVRLPRSWLALVDEVVGDVNAADPEDAARHIDSTVQEAAEAVVQRKDGCRDENATRQIKEAILESMASGPDITIPIELLSPPASREPSRDRPRQVRQNSRSPARWTLMRSITNALQSLLIGNEGGMYVDLHDRRPGRYIQQLDFNHFRTIGMRRSVDEGVNSRFVTGDRLEALLRETPNLTAFGATEYMDGALTLPVLKELFLRGSGTAGRHRPTRRGRTTLADDAELDDDVDPEEAARRRECRELNALDFTGCVSAVFVNALTELSRIYFAEDSPNPILLYGLHRLSFRGAKSLPSASLHGLVLNSPYLTHLDLSGTRVEPALLDRLASSTTLRLYSLSLSRCVRLTGHSIHKFLMHAPGARTICELNLYGDGTYPCPLSGDELRELVSRAPCFTSGMLRYLDLSSAPLDADILSAVAVQPALRSLGLAHIPSLPLDALAVLLPAKAPAVEVLALTNSGAELGYGAQAVSVRSASLALHTKLINPLCMPPFSLSGPARPPPTRLRVIELAAPLLSALGRGGGSWRVVRSKGGRGWYVDSASGWIAEADGEQVGLRRGLGESHPWRVMIEKLADAKGNVNSGVGWHARKMEVLYGRGLLGREDGLYGAVSFAYAG